MASLLRLLFPQKCLLCGKLDSWICNRCREKLPKTYSQICPACLRSSLTGMTHSGCKKNSLNGLYSPFAYRGGVKKLLKTYKFKLVKELQETITNFLFLELEKNGNLLPFWQKGKYILIPLPLHPIKEKWRGFNQSLLVGRVLAKKLNLDYDSDLLKRINLASPQVGLSKEKRLINIKGQFQSNLKVKNKNIVIFDDVWTTGSTLKEAGKELKLKEAKSIWGLTFCRS